MSRGQMLEAFEAHKAKIAKSLIDGGEGKRVRDYLERHVRLSDFEAGWEASNAKPVATGLVVNMPKQSPYANTVGDYANGYRQASRDWQDAVEAAGVKVAP